MAPFKVKAVYEYSSPHDDDLHFPVGQVITVIEEEDADWYVGEYVDDNGTKQEGLFPKNFVEKYEPVAPPRPNRASRVPPLEPPQAHVAPPTPQLPQQEPQDEEPEPPKAQPPPVQIPDQARSLPSPKSPVSAQSFRSPDIMQEPPSAPKPVPAEPSAPVAPKPAPTELAKKPPPPIAKKTDAFRDRLAMFNQGTAAPQPFKPSGAPTTFIKKPFVAPPPSRNAYVPPPREAPQVKSYRRDEDPEIAERQARDQENAERAGLSGQGPTAGNEDEEEEQPKVLSLKERMALLQKQQQEQADRAAHKEKPKRPPVKKRTESHGERGEEHDGPSLEKVASGEQRERASIDNNRPPRSSHGIKSPDLHPSRELLSDANDADQSGAGETEDAEGTSTSVDDDDERSKHRAAPRAASAPTKEPDVGDEQDVEDEEEEEEDEMDAETRRKQELRERMARLGGGFNPMMPGMNPFGAPMGGLPPKKKKAPEKRSTEDSEQSPVVPQQRVPMFPGMLPVKSPEVEDKQLHVEKEDSESHPITDSRDPDEVPDVEDVTPQQFQRTPTAEQPPPIPSESKFLIPRKPLDSCCVHNTFSAFHMSSSETVSKTYVASDGRSEYVMTVSVCSMSRRLCNIHSY